MKKKLISLTIVLLLIYQNCYSQDFGEIPVPLPDVYNGEVDWGDYDKDGDLDILICGFDEYFSPVSKIFRNDGNNSFTEQTGITLTGVYYCTADWVDYDNDGDLDIMISGLDQSNIPRTVIYRNIDNNTFSEQTGIALTGLYYSSASWGDYDNDGDPDILLSGRNQSGIPVSKVYRNNGNNSFAEQSGIALTAVDRGACSWVDYDNDGDLDIMVTGFNNVEGPVSRLFKNNGNNSFAVQPGISFDGVYYSSIAWGDYDNDEYLDVLLCGYNSASGQRISKVYKNNNGISFTEQTGILLTGIHIGSAAWGDYDNDGDLDILLSGYSNSAAGVSEIYKNDGNNIFTRQVSDPLTGIYYSTLAWADYDNDYDLDILLSGYTGTTAVTKIYKNNCAVQNTPPSPPRNLDITMNGTDVTFTWEFQSENETPWRGISYNIRIGTSPGSSDIKSAVASNASGYHYLAGHGNVGHTYAWTIKDLTPGSYYWSVQAIDHGYLASGFAGEKAFETYFTEAGFGYSGTGTPYLADYDRDGDLDILASNTSGSTIFRNDLSTGSDFTDINVGIPYSYDGDYPFALGDYDNDGDIDIAHSARDVSLGFVTIIYRNDNGTFNDINADIQGIWMGKMAWGDYDNDGDLDLFLYGNHEQSDDGEPLGLLYRNDGNDLFTNTKIYIEDARRGALALADYDKDGFLDILTCGYNLSANIFTSVLKNINGSSFNNINAGIEGYSYGDLDWGDYDNDGYQDIFITGGLYGGEGSTRIFHNSGDGSFTDIGINFSGNYSYRTTSEWGDYDNDGDLDVLSSGENCIIRNDGNNVFTVLNVGISLGSGRWGDIDNDGDLDIVTESSIYINNIETPNNSPDIPVNLQSAISGSQASLSWDISNDDITPSNGITYNVCVGTSPGNWDILSPMTAQAPAFSKAIPGMGNAFSNTFKIVRNLPVGTYYWSVQSVDNGFVSSDFAPAESFEIFPMFTNSYSESWYNINGGWGDYDNDGDLDILCSLYGNISIHRNEGSDTFSILDPGIYGDHEYVKWVDYDNDGDLDIISTDSVFSNEPGNVFVNTGIFFGFINYSFKIGDYDADGDLDILSDIEYIYRNDGNSSFTPILPDLTDFGIELLDWFDYDNDGDLDIIITSGTYQNETTEIFRNDGNSIFTPINANMIGMDWSSISFADFDNDNDLDVYLGGTDSNNDHRTILYKNNGNDSFSDINVNIRGYYNPDSFWGDFNNDGYKDLIISGYNNGRQRNKMYQNNQGNTFEELSIENIIEYISIFYCADYDNDGDIDAITSDGVFRNNTNLSNDIPPVLTNLNSDLKGLDIRLSWNRASDPKEPGYSYNIKIGTTPGGTEIKSPVSAPGLGNVPTDTSWVIRNLPEGLYYWSVQAINLNHIAGPWAPVQSLLVTDVSPDFTYDTVCFGENTSFTDLSVTTDVLIAWKWNFGDGNVSNVRNPVHNYNTAGIFNVSLWVYSQSGDSAERIRQVIVKFAPDASFSVLPVCKDESSVLVNHSIVDNITIDSWIWDFGNEDVSSVQNSVEKTYIRSDTAVLTIVAQNGCRDADTQFVAIAEYPVSTISLSPGFSNVFCSGDSTVLLVPYNENYSYQWQLNGVNISGKTESMLIVKGNGGDYSINIENPVAGCVSTSTTQIMVKPMPYKPEIDPGSYEAGKCPGEAPLILSVDQVVPGYVYTWYKNGIPYTNTNSPYLEGFLSDGDYSVEADLNGCKVQSDITNLTFGDAPELPFVYAQGPTVWYLACSNKDASDYKWYYNGTLIPDADSYLYFANRDLGVYYVSIANETGCYTSSEPVLVPTGATGVDDIDPFEGMMIYPNPSTGMVTLDMDNNIFGDLDIRVTTSDGRIVLITTYEKTSEHFEVQIDLGRYGPGIYLLNIMIDEYAVVKKVIVK